MTSHERIAAIVILLVLVGIEARWRPAQRIWNRVLRRHRIRVVPNKYAHEEHYPQPAAVGEGRLRDETPAATTGQLLSTEALTQAYERLAEPCRNTRCRWFGEDHIGDCEKAELPPVAPPLAPLPAFTPGRQPWEDEPENDSRWDEAPLGRVVAVQFSHNGHEHFEIIQPDGGGLQFTTSTWLPYPDQQQEPAAVLGSGLVVEDDDAEGPLTRRVRENLPYIQDAYEAWLDAEIDRRKAASMVELDEAFAVSRIREHALF